MKNVRTAALICLVAGILGFVSGAVLAVIDPAVGVERFSYPLDRGGFAAIQVWFALQHLGLLAGLLALTSAGVLPGTRAARWGWASAVLGMGALAATELVAIAAAEARADSTIAGVLGALYGITCTAIGLGLVLCGLAIRRTRVWGGWRRDVVLALGVWVFVPLFPALIATPTDGARWAIGGWMLLSPR